MRTILVGLLLAIVVIAIASSDWALYGFSLWVCFHVAIALFPPIAIIISARRFNMSLTTLLVVIGLVSLIIALRRGLILYESSISECGRYLYNTSVMSGILTLVVSGGLSIVIYVRVCRSATRVRGDTSTLRPWWKLHNSSLVVLLTVLLLTLCGNLLMIRPWQGDLNYSYQWADAVSIEGNGTTSHFGAGWPFPNKVHGPQVFYPNTKMEYYALHDHPFAWLKNSSLALGFAIIVCIICELALRLTARKTNEACQQGLAAKPGCAGSP